MWQMASECSRSRVIGGPSHQNLEERDMAQLEKGQAGS